MGAWLSRHGMHACLKVDDENFPVILTTDDWQERAGAALACAVSAGRKHLANEAWGVVAIASEREAPHPYISPDV